MEPKSKSLDLYTIIGAPGPEVWGKIHANLDIKVDSPDSVKNDQAFIIKATVLLKEVNFIPYFQSPSFPGIPYFQSPSFPGMTNFPPTKIREIVERKIEGGNILFSLHIADAIVEPKGKTPISKKGVAQWSVKLEKVGPKEGFLKPEFLKSSGGHQGQYRIEYHANDFIPINISSNERFITTKRIISVVTGFFGGLLTLPGILAFMADRRKRRDEKEAEKQALTPRIITTLSSYMDKSIK